MKKNILFSIIALLAGCAAPTQKAYIPAEFVADAITAQTVCAFEKVATVDDGLSDATTVARALAQVCGPEYRRVTNAFATANLDNERQKQIFRQRRNSTQQMIDDFLPVVMEHRTSLRQK